MPVVLVLVVLGPAQAIAGKYVQHAEEYLELYPPHAFGDTGGARTVDELCRRIEAGRATPEDFAALGDKLLARGDKALAYRAFHKAHRLRPADTAWGRRMNERKYLAERVPDALIRAEEREAEIWVKALQDFERARIARNDDPHDLTDFYAQYGRPEESLWRVVRARRFSWAGGVAGVLLGVVFAVAARLLPRWAAVVPLAVGGCCLLGPAMVGRTGLFSWGAAFALVGGAIVLVWGRKRGAQAGLRRAA